MEPKPIIYIYSAKYIADEIRNLICIDGQRSFNCEFLIYQSFSTLRRIPSRRLSIVPVGKSYKALTYYINRTAFLLILRIFCVSARHAFNAYHTLHAWSTMYTTCVRINISLGELPMYVQPKSLNIESSHYDVVLLL